MQIAQAINYKGHVIYTDGRVYKHYELIAECKTLAAAKRIATIERKKELNQRSNDHHNFIQSMMERRA